MLLLLEQPEVDVTLTTAISEVLYLMELRHDVYFRVQTCCWKELLLSLTSEPAYVAAAVAALKVGADFDRMSQVFLNANVATILRVRYQR